MRINKANRAMQHLFLHLFLAFCCILALVPIAYTLSVSLNADGSLLSSDFSFFPENITLENYRNVFTEEPVLLWFGNTIILVFCTILLSLAVAVPASYVFSRWRFPGRKAILKMLLLLYSFPSILSMFAIYKLMSSIGLLNTRIGLIVVYAGTMAVFAVWNMKGYFDTIPIDIENAARIDGAGDSQIVLEMVLPLARPSIIVTATMILNFVWNEYIFSINFLTGSANTTLASGLYGLQATELSGSWPIFASAAVIISFPVLIIFFLSQKYMTSGLSAGGVKE